MNYPPPPPPPPANFLTELRDTLRDYPAPPPPTPAPVPPPPPPAQPAPTVDTRPELRKGPKINVRQKGQRGEREVVKLLQNVVDIVRLRLQLPAVVLQRNALQAHLGGEDIHGLQGFSVEVKFQECDYNPAWWRQCLAQAEREGATPVLFWRASKQKWKVKFRSYVETRGGEDSIEMDIETSVDDFITWFAYAYAEEIKP